MNKKPEFATLSEPLYGVSFPRALTDAEMETELAKAKPRLGSDKWGVRSHKDGGVVLLSPPTPGEMLTRAEVLDLITYLRTRTAFPPMSAKELADHLARVP